MKIDKIFYNTKDAIKYMKKNNNKNIIIDKPDFAKSKEVIENG